MSKQIINGIDVSECKYFNKVVNEEPYCNINEEHLYTCSSDENCYFKQLKRLQEENEGLKEKNKCIIKNHIDVFGDYQKYKQALEEIREILCQGKTFYDGYFENPNLSRTDKAIKLINEVLNER